MARSYIVVVDDDPLVHRFIQQVTGLPVRVFRRGETVLRSGRMLQPAACFVDIFLDGPATGISILSDLRRMWTDVPIIAMTSAHGRDLVRLALAGGADDFIRKPLDSQELLARLHKRTLDHAEKTGAGQLFFADLTLDYVALTVSTPRLKISLDQKQIAILKLLMAAAPHVVPHATFMQGLWGSVKVSKNALERKVSQIRDCLKKISTRVELVSRYGKGYQLLSAGEEASVIPLKQEISTAGGKTQVLIVEDNKISRTVLTALCEDLGCDVQSVESAEEALIAVRKSSFHMIMLDQFLPGMNGTEVAPLLKSILPEATIIGIFGTVTPDQVEIAQQSGITEVAGKPMKMQTCKELLTKYGAAGSRNQDRTLSESPANEQAPPAELISGLDAAVTTELLALGGGEAAFLRDMLTSFLSEFLLHFARGSSINDTEHAVSWAHKLKGLCCNIGALRLGAMFEELEASPKLPFGDGLKAIEEEFHRQKTAIEAYLK